MWEGDLTPICQTYRVRIRYFPYRFWEKVTIGHPYVTVKVIDPVVAPDPRGTGEPTPHVYSYGYPPELPALCIFDPVQDEWGPHEYIVDKIVPWTIKWLMFYEDWLDTGTWQGRGRHPDPTARLGVSNSLSTTSSPRDIQAERQLFHTFGLRVRIHTSARAIAISVEQRYTDAAWPPDFHRPNATG